MGVGIGEGDHGKRADGRDGHEEALVKGLAVADVVPGLLQHVVASDHKGHQEQDEARVDVARLAKEGGQGAQLIGGKDHGKDAQSKQDAVQFVLQRLLLAALLLFLLGVRFLGVCHVLSLN